MSDQPRGTSLEKISLWIRDAAVSKSWRPGHHLGPAPTSLPVSCDARFVAIQFSLNRARTKAFVRAIKPFRRLLRNQGAVNDSLIEAVHHLAAKNQEMVEQMNNLRDLVSDLRSELRQAGRLTTPENRTGEKRETSAGEEARPLERSSSPVADASDGQGSCV